MSIWKPVPNEEYAQFNEISDKGEVRRNNRVLAYHIRNGYRAVCLYSPKTKKKYTENIHRMVAGTFIPNQDRKTFVNHKDGNKHNNVVSNLEWTTPQENTEHALETGIQKGHPKSVDQYSMKGDYIATFISIVEAARKTGANDRQISSVCLGKRTSSGGFIWKYTNGTEAVRTRLPVDGKAIDGFPNYLITEDKRVYSKRSKKYLKPKILESGYECVKLCNNGVMKDAYICKLVREYFGTSSQKEPLVLSQRGKPVGGSGENSEV